MANFNEVYFYKGVPYDRFKFVNEKSLTMSVYSADFIPSSHDQESSEYGKGADPMMDDMESIKEF